MLLIDSCLCHATIITRYRLLIIHDILIDMTKLASDLPIFQKREAILQAVDSNQVTIITAETGAGKSTQVPQYLLEHGYEKVIVTQPRILAARNLTRRVREEWAERTLEDSSEVIGYRTAHERDDSPDTKILYCTDGLQLVREITGIGVSEQQVLVLDEVHEWNVNMEVLVAWAKLRCQEDPRFKIVVMSATLEAERLAEYFEGAAIISVEGRSFPVAKSRGADVVAEILNKIETNHNMLVFLPRKARRSRSVRMISGTGYSLRSSNSKHGISSSGANIYSPGFVRPARPARCKQSACEVWPINKPSTPLRISLRRSRPLSITTSISLIVTLVCAMFVERMTLPFS